MRLPGLSSIRAQLVVLVLLAVLPALGIMLFTGFSLRDAVVRAAEDSALRQVQAMAAHHDRVVDNARLLLATLAKAREVQQGDAPADGDLIALQHRHTVANRLQFVHHLTGDTGRRVTGQHHDA